jgi:hypothetical protein
MIRKQFGKLIISDARQWCHILVRINRMSPHRNPDRHHANNQRGRGYECDAFHGSAWTRHPDRRLNQKFPIHDFY